MIALVSAVVVLLVLMLVTAPLAYHVGRRQSETDREKIIRQRDQLWAVALVSFDWPEKTQFGLPVPPLDRPLVINRITTRFQELVYRDSPEKPVVPEMRCPHSSNRRTLDEA